MSVPDSDRPQRRAPVQPGVETQAVRTRQWLDACEDIVRVRASLDAEFPSMSVADLDRFMALLVIRNNLGEEWVDRHVEGVNPTKSSVYLRSVPMTSLERHEHYVRVMELGRRIFELGQEPFADRLYENLRRRDLEGAAFEADVVRMLVAAPFVVDLREEAGVRGDDYDIDLWLRDDLPWSIEAKTRAENVTYSAKALTKTLSNAREQLPRDGVGTIFLKVPTSWLSDGSYRREHADTVEQFLGRTNRVQSVVLVWDDWTPKTFGRGFDWRRAVRVIETDDLDERVAHLLRFYEQIWAGPGDLGPTAPF